MDLWVSFWSSLTTFIADHGLLTVAVLVLIKSAGVPLPVPADLLVVFVGVDARAQGLPLWPAWLLLSLATVIGATLLYGFARWIGPEDVAHYGRYVGLSQHRLNDAEIELRLRGRRAIFVARVVPGLRLAIVVVCGILGIRPRVLLPAMGLAALAYDGFCLMLGYVFGEPILAALGQMVFPVGLLVPSVAVALLLIWLVRARRLLDRDIRPPLAAKSRMRAGALAGALAIGGSTMTVNALIYLGGPLAVVLLAAPGNVATLLQSVPVGLVYVLGSIVVVVVLGVVWGASYGLGEGRWLPAWPDWLSGLAFAALPLGLTLLLASLALVPAVQSQTPWLVALVGEAVRWAIYGVLLGLIYPIFRARRVAKPSVSLAYSRP
jgi:membrane protein DedA with SNARE-associated domain